MSEAELYQLLTSLGLAVAYDHFDTPNQTPPFILYRSPDVYAFKADNKTYYKQNNYIVDLITDIKDVSKEALIEELFDNNSIPYDKEENYIEIERIYQIRYFI